MHCPPQTFYIGPVGHQIDPRFRCSPKFAVRAARLDVLQTMTWCMPTENLNLISSDGADDSDSSLLTSEPKSAALDDSLDLRRCVDSSSAHPIGGYSSGSVAATSGSPNLASHASRIFKLAAGRVAQCPRITLPEFQYRADLPPHRRLPLSHALTQYTRDGVIEVRVDVVEPGKVAQDIPIHFRKYNIARLSSPPRCGR